MKHFSLKKTKFFKKFLLSCVFVFVPQLGNAQSISKEFSAEKSSQNTTTENSPTRIGFVSVERLLRESEPARAAQKRLDQEFGKRDKELQSMAARLKDLASRLERDASVLSDSERSRRKRELDEQERSFQRRQREYREDLSQRRNEELGKIIERANREIKSIAEKNHYDLIIQESIIASRRVDITDQILSALAGTTDRSNSESVQH